MITVAGEALIDIVVDDAGAVSAHPGGAPLNVARAVARLGGACRFLGRISSDGFGERLRESVLADEVELMIEEPTPLPSTLAVATLDSAGSADYRFYLHGTSAGQLLPEQLSREAVASGAALIVGGLGLVMEPICSTLLGLLERVPAEVLVLVDPNCRPSAVEDRATYMSAVTRALARADIVKVSVEDLAYLGLAGSAADGAAELLRGGARAVLVTDGPQPVQVHTRQGRREVPVPSVAVVDTVGSGDAFVAGFMTSWVGGGGGRDALANVELVADSAAAAVEVSALTCMRAGADPPRIPDWLERPGSAAALIRAAAGAQG